MDLQEELDTKTMISLLTAVLEIEKRYAHELTGVRDTRRKEIKDLISKVVGEKLEK